MRDVFTEESLLLSRVQQGRVFEQQKRGYQVPSQGGEKVEDRGGRHLRHRAGSLPPPGPLNSAAAVATAATAALGCSPPGGASGAALLSALAHHAGAGGPCRTSNKEAPARRRTPAAGKEPAEVL